MDKADHQWDALFHLPLKDLETSKNPEVYAGLSLEALQTSYQDYETILKDITPGKRLCDLGAGFGRGSFLSQYLGLNNCTSIEFSQQRIKTSIEGARKLGFDEADFVQGDITTCDLSPYDAFFFYFPLGRTFLEVLYKLFILGQEKEISLYVIESHGDMIPFLDHLEGLERVSEWKLNSKRHYPKLVKYQVKKPSPSPEFLFMENMYSDRVYRFSYEHKLLHSSVDWIIPLRACTLEFFEKTFINFLPFERQIELNLLGPPEQSSDLERELLKTSGKLLKNGVNYYSESRLGDISAL